MHSQSPPLTIGRTVLKESDDLVILGVTFDLKMTFEKHLCSISNAASQRLGILRKSWRVFHDRSLLGRSCPANFGVSYQFWSVVLLSGARLLIHTLNYWIVHSVVPGLSVTLLIADPWQSCVCFIRSGVTQCTLLMVLYLDRMCQCRLHEVLSSHIDTLMHCLAAETCRTAGLLFPYRCPSGTI